MTYIHYSEGNEPLVYVQSSDALDELLQDVEETANRFDGMDTEIIITNGVYWPLPWCLKDYKRVAWHGKPVYNLTAPIVISGRHDFSELREDLKADYIMKKYNVNPNLFYVYYKKSS